MGFSRRSKAACERRQQLQPRLLSRLVPFHRLLIERGENVVAQRAEQIFDDLHEVRIVIERGPEAPHREAEFATRQLRTRPFYKIGPQLLLLVDRQLRAVIRRRGDIVCGCRRCNRPAPRNGFFRGFPSRRAGGVLAGHVVLHKSPSVLVATAWLSFW